MTPAIDPSIRSTPSILKWLRFAAVPCILCITTPAAAATDLPAICEAAAAEASQVSGVPLPVLMAISLNETGRKSQGRLRPWPWTVNMEGKGEWFDTPDEALAYVYKEFKRGARSFDVGCFQINYKWHNQHFTSIEQMFDPRANALYAARFLTELYAEKGSWTKAAGAYHSRTPENADRYAARFDTFRAKIEGRMAEQGVAEPEPYMAAAYDQSANAPLQMAYATPGDIPEVPEALLARLVEQETQSPAPRVNTYPLLQASAQAGGMGSLVPMVDARPGMGSLFGTTTAVVE